MNLLKSDTQKISLVSFPPLVFTDSSEPAGTRVSAGQEQKANPSTPGIGCWELFWKAGFCVQEGKVKYKKSCSRGMHTLQHFTR